VKALLRVLRAIGRFVFRVVYAAVNAVYKTTTRMALYLATAYLVIYFTINSGMFREQLMSLLGDVMPGQFEAAALQWGPFPTRITLVDVGIRDPAGTPVIDVDRLTTNVDLLALWGWGVRKFVFAQTPLHLRLREVTIDGADVLVEVTDAGWVGVAAAFTDVTKPPEEEEEKGGARIEIENIMLEGSRVRVDTSRVQVDTRGLSALARVVIQDGRVVVTAPRILSDGGDATIAGAGPDGTELRVPWTDFEGREGLWDSGLLELERADLKISEATGDVRHLRIDMRETENTVKARLSLTGVRHEDPLIGGYVGEMVKVDADLDVVAEGPFAWPHLTAGITCRRLEVDQLHLGPIDLDLAMVSNGFLRTIELSPLSLDLGGETVHLDLARLIVPDQGVDSLRMHAALRLDGVVPERLWDLGVIGGQVEVPVLGDATVDGSIEARAGMVRNPDGTVGWRIDSALQLAADWPGDPSLPIGTDLGVVGNTSLNLGSGDDTISTDGLWAWSGQDEAQVSGRLDLLLGELDFGLSATIHTRELLGAFGIEDIDCVVGLAGGHVTGTLLSPDLVADLSTSRCDIYGNILRDIAVRLKLIDGTVDLSRFTARNEWGGVTTDARLEVWRGNLKQLSKRMPLTLTNLKANGIKLAKLKVMDLSGTASVRSKRFSLALGVPGLDLDGSASLSVAQLRIIGENFHHFAAEIAADAQRNQFKVLKLDARTLSGARLRGSGSYNRDSEIINADVEATAVDLTRLSLLSDRAEPIPLKGVVDLSLDARGTLASMQLSGRLTTRRFAYDDIYLGDATVNFKRPRGSQKVTLTSRKFFRSMKMKSGVLELDKNSIPTRVLVVADLDELDVLKVLPAYRKWVTSVTVKEGEGIYDLHFNGKKPMRLVVDLPDDSVRIKLTPDLPAITHHGPLKGSLIGTMTTIEQALFDWEGQRLGVCGTLNLKNQKANLDVAGTIQLDKLADQFEALGQMLADLSGRLVTHGTNGTTSSPFADSCLRTGVSDSAMRMMGRPRGYLRITNTLMAPTITGGLRVDRVTTVPRGLGREVGLTDGVILLRASGEGAGSQELAIAEKHPLQGTFEDGTFRLHGRVKLPKVRERLSLDAWLPDKGTLYVGGEDIEWAVPREYRLTLDPEVAIGFSGLSTAKPKLSLSGKVAIVDGAYFKNFSFFTRAVGNILGRSVSKYEEPLTEKYPILKELKLNLKVTGNNFLVQSDFGVGETDLETSLDLRAEGTFEDPVVKGQVEVVDGTITYTVVKRQFEVTSGVITFDGKPETPKLEVEAQTTIANAAATSSNSREDEDIVITVRVDGRVPNYKITLDSSPTLAQIDIQYLILTGSTKSGLETGGTKTTATLDLLSANLANVITNLIRAPFVESVHVAPDTKARLAADFIFRLGRQIRFGVTSRENDSQRTYDIRYRHKFRDNLELEATRRGADDESDSQESYEVRLKYTVPLD